MAVIIKVRVIGQDANTSPSIREELGDVADFDNYSDRGWNSEDRNALYYRLFLIPNLKREDLEFLRLNDPSTDYTRPWNFRFRKIALDVSKLPISEDRTEPIVEWDVTLDQIQNIVIKKETYVSPNIFGDSNVIFG